MPSYQETLDHTFPWRVSGLGSYKRDTGDSKESVAHYGPLNLVFVHPPLPDFDPPVLGWTASLMGHDGSSGSLGPFDTAKEARAAADDAWPWWTGEGPAPTRAWYDNDLAPTTRE